MRIYIASWGDPSGWRPVDYIHYQDEEKKIRSLSSVSFFDKHYNNKNDNQNDIETFYILVQDSVLFTNPKRDIDGIVVNCAQQVKAYETHDSGKLIWLQEPPSTYEDLVKTIQDYVQCILRGQGIRRKTQVIVVPSNITVIRKSSQDGSYLRFSSSSNYDFMYSMALMSLYENAVKNGSREPAESNNSNNRPVKIVVDTTHGINYFAIMTTELARDLAGFLSIKIGGRVNVEFWNAIMKSTEEYLVTKVATWDRVGIRDVKVFNKGQRPVYRALSLNSPLALIYVMSELRNSNNSWTLDARSAYKRIKLLQANGLEIKYNLEQQDYKKLDSTYMAFLIDVLMEKFGKSLVFPVSYEVLLRLKDEVYGLVSETAKDIIEYELNNLYRGVSLKIKELMEKGDKIREVYKFKYTEIIKYGGNQETTEGKDENLDKAERNMRAHAGLLRDYVCVECHKLKDEELEISLSYDNWESVKKILEHGK
ncbi:TM1812 family CRISPR-associated protein [Metallosphaera hakonensis]|nr:CRISPR-associated DxTHG motif protein [Metallosphaera hakonensis]